MGADVFWDGWQGPLRVAVMALLSYLYLIVLLRVTGKRTLSKMNAFDFIITVASGSTFATVLLNKDVSYVEGAVAFAMLVLMQYGVAFLSTRSHGIESLVKSTPTLLVWRGRMRPEAMKKARVTEAEVLAACRESGLHSLQEVEAVVLETAGEFSVLEHKQTSLFGRDSTLQTVDGVPAGGPED